MPLFDLHCPRCCKDFKAFLRLSEAKEGAPCPSCREKVPAHLSKGADPQTQLSPGSASISCSLPQRG
jgi:putative FmdB family regulatory protein